LRVNASRSACKYDALVATNMQAEVKVKRAEAKVKKLEGEAEQYKAQLEAAQKDARDANERIVEIWAEMQRNDSAAEGEKKRKAEEERAGGDGKRTRMYG
jgi:outer membrane murein-binding lipoprotein Lpp